MTSLQIRIPVVLAVLIACSVPASMSAARVESPRQIVAADASWKFYLGDPGGRRCGRLQMARGGLLICRTTGASRVSLTRTIPAAQGKDIFLKVSAGTARHSTPSPVGEESA